MSSVQGCGSNMSFLTPSKSLRGGHKALSLMEEGASADITISDEMALRKAEEAASRRFQATEWLRQMDHGAYETLPKDPSEEEFCLALRNGLILCNLLNKVSPGAVLKVVENRVIDVQLADGAAQSAIQYFENMRNFLVAVEGMQLLTFEASDLEKGGSSNKVVDCILCLKGYHEWKQAGGIGIWKYGGTVRITSSKGPSLSLFCGESNKRADVSLECFMSPHKEQLLEILHLAMVTTLKESKAADILSLLFDKFGVQLLRIFAEEVAAADDLPFDAMFVDFVLGEAINYLFEVLHSNSNKLGLVLRQMLEGDACSKEGFGKALSKYIGERSFEVSTTCPKCETEYLHEAVHGEKRLNIHSYGTQEERIESKLKQLEELKTAFHETKLEVQNSKSKWDEELKTLTHHIQGLEVAASSYHNLLEENQLLCNQVQDLKGSIRVYCRVRPFFPGQSDGKSTVDYIGENGSIMIFNPHKHGKDARRIFSFNKVFGTNATQEQVFADTQPLIRSVLDGYNVCIFAYGQTGSGKTYTMSGPDLTTEETWGVNYRALSDLFQLSNTRKHMIAYDISAQMIEIYNEQVRDLLASDGSNRRYIRNNSQQNGLNVPDASLVSVCGTQDVLDLLRIGQKNRAVGATALNIRSSRSHSVLIVHVRGKELASGSILRGCLHFVDLAGSERVDKSEAVGERLKEAQHINKSLSALGDVIAALAQKSAHIPYRNSKLTQVLQDSLGGQAKTLMFVHINPEVNAFGETISTLKFAERVASIELGAARTSKETGEIRELKDEISNLKLTLGRKEAELVQLKATNAGRLVQEMNTIRPISPVLVQSCANNVNFKPEINRTLIDEPPKPEVRSSSSGKQRRTRFPPAVLEKEYDPKNPLASDGRYANSRKPRSPSPPVRRSTSTDRGSLIRNNKINLVTFEENQITSKSNFLSKASVNKSLAAIPTMSGGENVRGRLDHQELPKQENTSEVQAHFYRINPRKGYTEYEEEQFKLALNIRQGGIKKNKTENKSKLKYLVPARMQRADAATGQLAGDLGNKAEAARKSDFSETENEVELVDSPVLSSLRAKKTRQNLTRISHNIEPRGSIQVVEPTVLGKLENKIANGLNCHGKEGSNTAIPDIKRSRSSPRGRFNMYHERQVS